MEPRRISIAVYSGDNSSESDLRPILLTGEKAASYLTHSDIDIGVKEFKVNIKNQPYVFKGIFGRMDPINHLSKILCDYTVMLAGKHAIFIAAVLEDASFRHVNDVLMKYLEDRNHSHLPIYLAVNNENIASERGQELKIQFEQLANDYDIPYLEYSAETGAGINELLTACATDNLRLYPDLVKPEKKEDKEKEVKNKDEGYFSRFFDFFSKSKTKLAELRKYSARDAKKDAKVHSVSMDAPLLLKAQVSFAKQYAELKTTIKTIQEKKDSHQVTLQALNQTQKQLVALAASVGASSRNNEKLAGLTFEINFLIKVQEFNVMLFQKKEKHEAEEKWDELKQMTEKHVPFFYPEQYKQIIDSLEEQFKTLYLCQGAPGGPVVCESPSSPRGP
jgi:hypothetical protein